jgi:hypothetical protein
MPFLEANWTSTEQLRWLRDAKRGVRAYFEQWYLEPTDPSISPTQSPSPGPQERPKKEVGQFEQWVKSRKPRRSETGSEFERYYRLEPQDVDDPVQWWRDHKSAFPQLSRLL